MRWTASIVSASALLLMVSSASAQTMPPADLCQGETGTLTIGAGEMRLVSGYQQCIRVQRGGTLVLADGATVGTVHALAGSTVRCLDGTITIADVVPTDRYQFRTGLVLEGHVDCAGSAKTAWTRLLSELRAGQTTITVEDATGWRVGDDVQIADTRELAPGTGEWYRALRTKITAVIGNTVTLGSASSLTFPCMRDEAGRCERYPVIGNLSRSVTIRSENPARRRGHVLVTRGATGRFSYVRFQALGRTTIAPLDPVANPAGRYALHLHMGTEPGFQLVGNAVENFPKWGITVHGTNGHIVRDNVIVNGQGAGIMTEDGTERDNVIDHNLVIGVTGDQDRGDAPERGKSGACIWLEGGLNRVTRNVAANCWQGYLTWGAFEGPFADNEAIANWEGLTPWGAGGVIERFYEAHSITVGFNGYPSVGLTLVDWIGRGASGGAEYNVGLWNGDYTGFDWRLVRPRVSGKTIGLIPAFGVSGGTPHPAAVHRTIVEDAQFSNNRRADILTQMMPVSYDWADQPPIETVIIRPRLDSPTKVARVFAPGTVLTDRPDALRVVDYQHVSGDSFAVHYAARAPAGARRRAGIDGLIVP
jgi:hypothetical protein